MTESPAPADIAATPAALSEVLRVLTRIEGRLDRLEARLRPALALIDASPTLAATFADVVDREVGDAAALDQRLRALARFSERLTRPEALRSFTLALDALQAAPGLVATLADALDENLTQPAELLQRARALGAFVAQLTRPDVLKSLGRLAESAEHLPALVATLVDSVDAVASRALAQGLPLDRALAQAPRLLGALARVCAAEPVVSAAEALAKDQRVHRMLASMLETLQTAAQVPVERVGVFGLLGALRRPSLQTALGWLIQVGSALGDSMKPGSDRSALPDPPLPEPKQLHQ